MKYFYQALGYSIASEFELLGLIEGKQNYAPDIQIKQRQELTFKGNALVIGSEFKLSTSEFMFSKDNLAHFLVSSGEQLEILTMPGYDIATLNAYILGISMGLLLFQRSDLVIHGSALFSNGKGLVVTGECGAGKSSLSMLLHKKGFSYMADDIVALHYDSVMALNIHHAYPQQRFTIDTINLLNIESDLVEKANLDDDKYIIRQVPDFKQSPTRCDVIIYISVEDQNALEVHEITGFDKLQIIINNIYCYELIQYLEFDKCYLEKIHQLAKQVRVFHFKRPRGINTLEEMSLIVRSLIQAN